MKNRSKNLVCVNCDKAINVGENYYESDYDTRICEECGNELLAYNDEYGYVFRDYDGDVIYDDAGADIEQFEFTRRES